MILPLLRPNILDRNLHSPAEEDAAAIFVRHGKRAIGRRRELDLLKTSLKILSGGLKVPAWSGFKRNEMLYSILD